MNVQQNFPRVQNFHDPRDSDTALGGLDRRTGQEPHTRVMEMFLVLKHNFFFLTMIYFKKKINKSKSFPEKNPLGVKRIKIFQHGHSEHVT